MHLKNLAPNPKNPRVISAEKLSQLEKSLKRFGSLDGFVYNKTTKRLIGGHQRQKIFSGAKIKGEWVYWKGHKWPYREVEWDEATEKAANIAANKGAGEWNKEILGEWFEELKDLDFDLNLTMFDDEELKEFLIKEVGEVEGQDAVPEIRKTNIKLGDLFQLGEHRLLCGDSTDKESVQKLMNGEKADMVFTDPPYGINVRGQYGSIGGGTQGSAKRQEIYGDEKQFNIKPIMKLPANQFFLFGGNFFAHELPRSTHWIIWNKHQKDEPVKSDFSDAELIWTNLDRKSVRTYKWGWTGRFRAGNQKDEMKRKEHPCQKPVGLIENIFKDYEAKLIIDPFLGSGSTLIACEKTNRKCYGMEIDPQYCQVIIDRWEKFTGQKAIKLENKKRNADNQKTIRKFAARKKG